MKGIYKTAYSKIVWRLVLEIYNLSVFVAGQHRTSVVLDGLLKPRALTVHGSFVYWVDSDTEMMHRSSVKEGSKATEVHGKFRSLSDIKAVNRTRRSGECDLESTSEDRFCHTVTPADCLLSPIQTISDCRQRNSLNHRFRTQLIWKSCPETLKANYCLMSCM